MQAARVRLFVIRLSLLAAAFTAACDSTSTAPTKPDLSVDCQLGCVDADPNPAAPGVFLGSAINPSYCWDLLDSGDIDQDALSDYCEKLIAAAFAPWMRYGNSDEVDGEGAWAARLSTLTTGGTGVRVVYMMNYYDDLGVEPSVHTACEIASVGGFLGSCDGHKGDGEQVALDVYYKPTTKHWILDRALLSQHTNWITVQRSGTQVFPTSVGYKDHDGAAPVVWVAWGKHANYESQAHCDGSDGSGITQFDDCTGNNLFFRANGNGNRNIGSRAHNILNCLATSNIFFNPPYSDPRQPECMWTADKFWGWNLYHTGDVSDGNS